MKQWIMTFFAISLFLLFSRSLICASFLTCRQEELEYALEVCERHSLENAMIDRAYVIEGEEELYADFLAEFFQCFEPKGPVTVEVYEISLKEGILDLSVKEEFPLFSNSRSVCARRCVSLQILPTKGKEF